MKRTARLFFAALGSFALAGVVTAGSPVLAACHHFSVSATPTSLFEGSTVTVTVSRDNMFAPSNIDISTVDGTAKAGEDYEAFHQTVSFTTTTSMQFTIKTLDDPEAEPSETFNLHLSAPGGCAVNPAYMVDKDVTVTINDNDVSSAAAGSPAAGVGAGEAPGLPPAGAAPAGPPLYAPLTFAALVIAVAGAAAWWIGRRQRPLA